MTKNSKAALVSVSVVLALTFFLASGSKAQAAFSPNLGTASTFGILAHTYTNTTTTRPTMISLDLGYTTFLGAPVSIGGMTYIGDAAYDQAGADQHHASAVLNAQPCTFTFAGAVDLATDTSHGPVGVYTSGVYCSLGEMTIGSGTITLSGAGTFIFRPSAGLTALNNSHVYLADGASACDVFWTPLSSHTVLGSNVYFNGTVIEPSGADISIGYDADWTGRALAYDGSVTTNPIVGKYIRVSSPTCAAPPPPPPATLHVIKLVINNDGGTAVASSAIIHVANSLGDVAGSPQAGAGSPGTAYSLDADTYTVSENDISGYAKTISGDCAANGNITLVSGDSKTCIVTNDDIAPPPAPATLHVVKNVVNDNGGTAVAASALIHVRNGSGDVVGSPHAGTAGAGIVYSLTPGTYSVAEDNLSGYAATFSGNCAANGNITLVSGDNKVCIITNDDIASSPPPPSASLHVIKNVINDNGGTAVASSAIVHVTNGQGDVVGSPKLGAGSPGTAYSLVAGNYNVSENFLAGYAVAIGGDCAANGNITLAPGDDKTCTITNNDVAAQAPEPTPTPTPTPIPTSCDLCAKLSYDLYIINPDGSQRHSDTAWVQITDRGNGVQRYSFEDKSINPTDPSYDYNDSVIDVDLKDCQSVTFMFVSSDAKFKHQVRFRVSIDGVIQTDTLVTDDSDKVVGTTKTVNATTGIRTAQVCSSVPTPTSATPSSAVPSSASSATLSKGLGGKILLQVQQHGEAWYVHPVSGKRYYMQDGPTAYGMMRSFGLGITDANLANIPSVTTTDELKQSFSVCSANSAANKVKGKILLQVQQHGEAWYVATDKCRRIYMKDGAAAYTIMRFLGLGITDADLQKIPLGE
ncbi:MAG: ice-binding family protein [Patescibacteria group bacterium]